MKSRECHPCIHSSHAETGARPGGEGAEKGGGNRSFRLLVNVPESEELRERSESEKAVPPLASFSRLPSAKGLLHATHARPGVSSQIKDKVSARSSELLQEFTVEEVRDARKWLRKGKAAGLNLMS